MKKVYYMKKTSRRKLQLETVLKVAGVCLLCALLVFVSCVRAQGQGLTITQSSNSQALSQLLAGPGVTISNYTLTCAANGSGTFTNNSSNLGINGGVVLASGRVQNIPQAANIFASSQFTTNGDAQLSTLTGGTIYDPCVLEFDVVSQGPLLKFDYVFASEEYPEWVCSQYNDVFGFFITGPNPGGGNYTNINIALIPNTNLPVAINTINSGTPGANANGGTCNGAQQSLSYPSLYTNNLSPVNANIVYDAMTHVLTATASVVPCQTYHLKIAIADVADRIYDSGVFLSAYSFTSNPISVSASSQLNYAGFSSAYEGCVGGTFTFTLTQAQTVDVHIPISVSGTATNGVDYDSIPATVIVPAGQTSVTVALNALVDGVSESAETVTVSVLDPCTGATSSSASITIQDDVPAAIVIADSTICYGQSAQLNASGGLSYVWSPAAGLSNPNINNPVATPDSTTTYTVSMTWGACTKTASVTIYVSEPVLTSITVPAASVCNGGTVQITATPSGGEAPYSYLWSNGAITPDITVATGGTYTVTTTDAFGCSASLSQAVLISNISLTGTSTNVSCLGGNNGAIDITVTGMNAPFTYNWGGGVTSQDRTNLVVGTYTVTASNTVGCSASASFTITQPSTNLTTSATNTSVSCNGGSNGTISLTANGGVSPYTYLWSNGATTDDLAGIAAGSYAVTVTDFNGCTASRTINITQPTAITTSETHVNQNCYGESIGSIDLSVSGGVGTYTYVWSNGTSTQDISSLSAGTYSVSVADSNSCVVTRSVVITEPSAVNATAATTNPGCFGSSNGSINLTVSGGTPGYTYNWSNGATTQNIASLSAGGFTVTITDANTCTSTTGATLTQPVVLAASTTRTNVTCNGGNNGTITLTVTGGTTPYTFDWGGGITTQNRTALTAGVYVVTVTDANGCTASRSTTITQPTAISVANTRTNVACNGGSNGSINITVTGGVSPYSYDWGGGITTEDRTNLTAGTYNVTVTDTRGCTASSSISITEPAVLTFAESHVDVLCNGSNTGSINVTISGGTTPYSYNWGGGITTQDRINLAAGTYTLTTTDNRGCTVTGTVNITQPAAISIAPVVTDATCAPGNNGEIDITVTGGTSPYTFNWGGGITTEDRNTLFAGTYTVTVTDNAACTASRAISVSQIGIGMTLSVSATNVSCNAGNNGAIDVTVTGGNPPLTYDWGGGITTQDRTSLTAGNYSITVTDGLGCSAISNANVTEPGAMAISVTKTDVQCFGESTGSILTAVSGGVSPYTYNWSGGATTQNRVNMPAGSYDLTVTDANLCTATATSIIIDQPASAVNLSTTVSNVSCFGGNNGTITLSANGGTPAYIFNWSNGSISQDLSNVASGNYSVTVTDANSCSASTSAFITQPAAAVGVSLVKTDLTCNGVNTGTITSTVSGGTTPYSFDWGGGITTPNRNSLAAGTYDLTVTDNNGCSASASIAIIQPAAISITDTQTNVTCVPGMDNGTITLTVTGGTGAYAFSWNDAVTTQNRTGLTAGTYTVTVTDANTCTSTSSTTITSPPPLIITLNSGTSVCVAPTGTATAVTNGSGTAPYSYLWSNGETTKTVNGLAPGFISVIVTDAAGACAAIDSIYVGLSGNNTDAGFSVSGNFCAPDAMVVYTHVGSNNTITHFWDFGDGSPSSNFTNPSHTYDSSGNYTVTHIVNRGFCRDTLALPVTIFQSPTLSIIKTDVTCNGAANGTIDLLATGSATFTYNWGGGVTTEDRTGLAPGSYTVTVTDPNTCTSTLTASITQPTVVTITNTNTNVSCYGGSNGAINITAVGGTPGYTYNWGSGITTEDRTGLAGGAYAVTVTDANLCTATSSISVYQPNAVNVLANVTNISCSGQNNGIINLTVTGGTGAYTYNWSDGAATQNRTSLSPGTYNVTVADANLCSASTSATVTQPNPIVASLATTDVTCFGGNNGSIITTNTTGGVLPYSYLWSDGSTNGNRSSLFAGSYSVTITDQNLCTATATTTVAQPPTAVNITVNNTTPVACYGNNTGTINITASGGVPGYTYLWSDNSNLEDRVNMLGGTYFVSASDQMGCLATASATINQPLAPLSIDTMVVADVLCYSAATGSITTTVTGGTTPYTFNWSNAATTQNIANAVSGTYIVTVTDNNSCTATDTASISQPAAALAASTTVTNVLCFGGNNGAITTTVAGGTTPYSFNWGGGVTTQNRTALTAGTYNVVVTDSNNCTTAVASTVTQPAAALTVAATSTDVSCFGGNDGAVTLTVSGGTTVYSFNWNDGVATQNRTGLTVGNYSVTVTDANSCAASTSAAVSQPVAALSVTLTTSDVSCYGGNNGAINTGVSGGTAPYAFDWGNSVTSQNRTSLTAGTYTVTVIDNKGCQQTATATITQPSGPLTVVTTATAVSCFGGSNGTIDVTVTGGTAPHFFVWSDGANTEDRTGLSEGSYSVTVTDVNSCTVTTSQSVSQPAAAVAASTVITNVACNGASTGAIDLAVTGGTTPYTFNWNGGATTEDRANLTAGNYNVTVTDANACSAVSNFTITQPSAFSISFTQTNVTCNGGNDGSINVSVSGATPAYTYLWNNGATTQNLNNIAAGNYTLTITDANTCTATIATAVTQPVGMSVTETHTAVSCNSGNNGTITITINGGIAPYNYAWTDGPTTQNRTNLTAGTYQLLVNDNNSCAVTQPIVITQPTAINISLTPAHVLCFGNSTGSVASAVSGGTPGYTYVWNTGATTANISNRAAGTYVLTVTDANACTSTASAVINQPSNPINISTTITNVVCYGNSTGAISVSVSGGTAAYSYNWGGGVISQNRTALSAGTYRVTVTDANACSMSASAVVSQPASAVSAGSTVTNVKCYGESNGAIDVTVNGGTSPYNYNWGGGVVSEDRNAVNAGTYTVTIVDANNCSSTLQSVVNQPAPLTTAISAVAVMCNGDSNGSINLTVSGGIAPYAFIWSNNATTEDINAVGAGIYSVVVSDANQCATATSAQVTEPQPVALTISAADVACAGNSTGVVNITVTGGTQPYQYQWSNAALSEDLAAVPAGAYAVTVTDAHGCVDTISAVVNTLPQLDVSGTTAPLPCQNAVGMVDVTVNSGLGPFTFQWSNGANSEDLTDVHPGTYTVVVRDVNGCAYDTTFFIENLDLFSVDATGGGTITLGDFAELHVTSTGSSLTEYNWTPAFNMDCNTCTDVRVQPGHPTVYTVFGIDTNGCVAQDTVSVDIIDDYTLWSPNAFTPNGDGNNDYFQIFGNLEGVSEIDVMVFNRWGEKVFDATQPDFKWDGYYRGEPAPQAVYVYVIQAYFLDGHKHKQMKGSITLIR